MKKLILPLVMALLLPQGAMAAEAEEAEENARLPIIMYHHLLNNSDNFCDYVLPVEDFKNDMDYLKANGYETVSVAELISWCDGTGELPPKPIIISFDDGYESVNGYAVPILEELGFGAVVSVVGKYCDIYTETQDHNLAYSYLDWGIVKELSERNFEIGCHTFDMHSQSPRKGCSMIGGECFSDYKSALDDDISQFTQRCSEKNISLSPIYTFPFGSYCSSTVEIIKGWGFRAALTCNEEVNILSGDLEELYSLGRFNRPYGVSTESFFSGVLE